MDKPLAGRIVAVDLGEKRIGLAISDPLGITAQGHSILRVNSRREAVQKLSERVRETGAVRVVVGLPLNMNGSRGVQAQKAYRFGDQLKKELDIPIVFWDERLSSRQAERVLLQADLSRRRRRAKTDKLAAQIILQSYLDKIGDENRT
jgi:putative Holliday junction resolvase